MVQKGEPVVRLDSRVHKLQLEIAEHLASAKSQIVAAEESFLKRQAIATKLIELESNGHASNSEIIRAEMELSIAKAKLLSAQEEFAVRQIERRRAQVQLDRRTIVAPFSGVVAKIHSREGEFLSPLRPEVVTLVQMDRLLANFAVPSSQVSSFEIGKEFSIELHDGQRVLGKVHSIGVETNAQSGTIEIKFVIENPRFRYRSGEICTLII
jgi:RND family efflux transporter MFP subunit